MEKNGTSASPATALARRVLPVPEVLQAKAPLWYFTAKICIAIRIFQKFDDFLNFRLGLTQTGDILERNFIGIILSKSIAFGFADTKYTSTGTDPNHRPTFAA